MLTTLANSTSATFVDAPMTLLERALDPTPPPDPGASAALLVTCALTVLVTAGFVIGKNTYDCVRQRLSRVTVVVVGAGPVGLTAALIAARSGKAPRVIVYEERSRADLVGRAYQMTLTAASIAFLRAAGVDFDNIEGCREQGCFFTRIGVFQEYMLDILEQCRTPLVEIRLGSKVRTV